MDSVVKLISIDILAVKPFKINKLIWTDTRPNTDTVGPG